MTAKKCPYIKNPSFFYIMYLQMIAISIAEKLIWPHFFSEKVKKGERVFSSDQREIFKEFLSLCSEKYQLSLRNLLLSYHIM